MVTQLRFVWRGRYSGSGASAILLRMNRFDSSKAQFRTTGHAGYVQAGARSQRRLAQECYADKQNACAIITEPGELVSSAP